MYLCKGYMIDRERDFSHGVSEGERENNIETENEKGGIEGARTYGTQMATRSDE